MSPSHPITASLFSAFILYGWFSFGDKKEFNYYFEGEEKISFSFQEEKDCSSEKNIIFCEKKDFERLILQNIWFPRIINRIVYLRIRSGYRDNGRKVTDVSDFTKKALK